MTEIQRLPVYFGEADGGEVGGNEEGRKGEGGGVGGAGVDLCGLVSLGLSILCREGEGDGYSQENKGEFYLIYLLCMRARPESQTTAIQFGFVCLKFEVPLQQAGSLSSQAPS